MRSLSKSLSPQSVNPAVRRFEGPVRLFFVLILLPVLAAADDTKLSDLQRQQIIRTFLAEHPFVHRVFPRGKVGFHIEGDKITPSEAEVKQLIVQSGVAAKPGERAKITAVRFVHHGVIFEINGGPVKRKKWSDRVSIGMNGSDTSKTPDNQAGGEDSYVNAYGSFVFLEIKDDTASLTTDKIKDMLAPVLDFKAMNVAEAYQKSLPPMLAAAVKNHRALVGMDREMVTCAMGRPPRRLRESKDGQDYEEWIYGTPPQDVEFVRFVEDKVVSIEDMKVSGEKVVRTQDEVGDLNGTLDASEQKRTRPDAMSAPAEERRNAPTLLRPDEKPVRSEDGGRDPNPAPPPDPSGSAPPNGPN
jgi:hypothetical protein